MNSAWPQKEVEGTFSLSLVAHDRITNLQKRDIKKRIAIWMNNSEPLNRFFFRIVSLAQIRTTKFLRPGPYDKRYVELLKRIHGENIFLQTFEEAHNVYHFAKAMAKIEGDMVEVGVFRGSSAKIICEVKGDKALHLFDTFEGLPEPGESDEGIMKAGSSRAGLEAVKNYLQHYPNVHFHKGLFPQETAGSVKNDTFSFVHLDANLYQTTLDSLEFFYGRMARGGVIITHDYSCLPGVRKAVDQFFEDKPEPIVELSNTQAFITKLSFPGRSPPRERSSTCP